MKAGLYDRVLRYSGQEEKAYAATNPMEYFAEASEAYFGTNDFFPFIRIELRRHDPTGHRRCSRRWGSEAGAGRGRSSRSRRHRAGGRPPAARAAKSGSRRCGAGAR